MNLGTSTSVDTFISDGKAFVLGAGFSKAISEEMPMTNELSLMVRRNTLIEHNIQQIGLDKLSNNFESMLSYLAVRNPWNDQSEYHANQALFQKIAKEVATIIVACETRATHSDEYPSWLLQFIEFLHKGANPVVTFNYDTLIERAAQRKLKIPAHSLYPVTMTNLPVHYRPPGVYFGDPPPSSFSLTKLHGSINWYHSGLAASGEEIGYMPIVTNTAEGDAQNAENYVLGKDRLIIPPVLQKTLFYDILPIRSLWVTAHAKLKWAKEIYFMGYSLPISDTTTRHLLYSAVKPDAKIFIVNREKNSKDKDSLIECYRSAMPQVQPSNFNADYVTLDGIRKAIEKL